MKKQLEWGKATKRRTKLRKSGRIPTCCNHNPDMVQQDKMTKEQRDPMGFYNIQPTQPPSQLLQPPPTFMLVFSQNQPPLVQSTYAGQIVQSNSQGIQQPVQYNPNTPPPSIPMDPPNSANVTSQKIPTSFPPIFLSTLAVQLPIQPQSIPQVYSTTQTSQNANGIGQAIPPPPVNVQPPPQGSLPLPQQNVTNPNQNVSIINPGNSVLSNNNTSNDTLATVLKGQQEWQDQAINVMSSLATKQDNALALEGVPVFTGKDKTIKIEDWIRAVEKAALLTDQSEKRIALQKTRGTPSRYI